MCHSISSSPVLNSPITCSRYRMSYFGESQNMNFIFWEFPKYEYAYVICALHLAKVPAVARVRRVRAHLINLHWLGGGSGLGLHWIGKQACASEAGLKSCFWISNSMELIPACSRSSCSRSGFSDLQMLAKNRPILVVCMVKQCMVKQVGHNPTSHTLQP